MSGSVNKVIIIGSLGRDPEVRSFQNGGKVCNLRIATSEKWRDKTSGEQKERTEWHSVAIMDENIVKVAEQYLRKGSSVYIEGQLETRKWQDQSGADKYTTEVVLRPFRSQLTMLGSKRDDEGGEQRQGGQERYDQSPQRSAAGARTGGAGGRSSDFDDEIPF